MKKLKTLLPLLLLIIFTACGDEKPEDVMEEDIYVTVFSELLVVNQLSDEQLDDANRQDLVDDIYEKYNTSEEEFKASHLYYQKQPEEQLKRLDVIEEMISAERDTIQASLREYQDEELRKQRAEADSLDALDQENQEPDN